MARESRSPLLDRPLVAVVSTTGLSGEPHAVPVWFAREDGTILVWTDAGRQWVRNLQRRPMCAVTVAEPGLPYGAVLLRGAASVDADAPDALDVARRITARYLPVDEVDGYVAQWNHLRSIVRIGIEQERGWGRGY
jgi:PPOX class probable F420-dependent enzyme